MDKKEIKFIISNSSPFNKLKNSQLDALIDIAQIKEYKNQEVIYSQGSPADYLCFLIQGRVAVSTRQDVGEKQIEILKRGICFGIISLLTDEPHSVSAKSIETSFILQVDKNKFKSFLRKTPLLSLDFSRTLSQRVKARTKPKRIFQSKKIAILGDDVKYIRQYMLVLAKELKSQTKKNVIHIYVVSAKEEHAVSNKVLSLRGFNEESLSDYLTEDGGCLYIGADVKDKFTSLLNFLSESYHFILYEVIDKYLHSLSNEFISSANQLHFIVSKSAKSLKQANSIGKKIRSKSLDAERFKIISSLPRQAADSSI